MQIAIFGKYFSSGEYILTDAYISVIEALKISGMDTDMPIKLNWLDSEEFDSSASKEALSKYDGIIIPGGFGSRGINGKINVITYARENKIPLFGLCYGMQLICIEYARNICNLENANTVEIDPDTQYPIVALMDEQQQILADSQLGGTMRLGSYQCTLKPGSIAANAYKVDQISERHRHRYEINPEYVEVLEKAGLVFSGTSPDGNLMEIAELPIETHPFFLGTQFHPEFLARVENPHPLFNAFLLAVHAHKNNTAD